MTAYRAAALLLLVPLLAGWQAGVRAKGDLAIDGYVRSVHVEVGAIFGEGADLTLSLPVSDGLAMVRIVVPGWQMNRQLGPEATQLEATWSEHGPHGDLRFYADRPATGQVSVRFAGEGRLIRLDFEWIDSATGARRALDLADTTIYPSSRVNDDRPLVAASPSSKPVYDDRGSSGSTGCDGDDWDDGDDDWNNDDGWDDDGWDDESSTGCEGDDLSDDSSDDWSDDSGGTGCEVDDTDSGEWEGDDLDSEGASCEGDDLGGEAVASSGRRRPSAQAARLFNQLPFLMVLIGVRLMVVRIRRRRR